MKRLPTYFSYLTRKQSNQQVILCVYLCGPTHFISVRPLVCSSYYCTHLILLNVCCLHRQGVDPPTRVFAADMPIKQLTGVDEYFEQLGWGSLPQVCTPSASADDQQVATLIP